MTNTSQGNRNTSRSTATSAAGPSHRRQTSISGGRKPPATAAATIGSTKSASQRSTVVRMNLFVLVRILFQYLERVDPSSLDLAKEVLKDCERKHNTKDSKYETLADAINERVRDAVGESHWAQARKIQKQLVINQQRKKLKALKGQARRERKEKASTNSSSFTAPPKKSESAASDDAMEAAQTMSALAQGATPPNRDGNSTPTRSNESSNSFRSLSAANNANNNDDGDDEVMGDSYGLRRPQFHGKSEE